MNIEYEATFTRIDKDDVRQKLMAIGAELVHPEYLMKRVVFHPPVYTPGGWLRVRQEAEKVTMTFKIVYNTGDITDQKEVELVIDSFEEGENFLTSLGAKKKAYQETKRETWQKDGVVITIDTWPGLQPFVEVEGISEEVVREVALAIGFDWDAAQFCEVSSVYLEELGIPQDIMKDHMPVITFEHPPTSYVAPA